MTTTATTPDAGGARWVTVPEAVELTGKSERTIRRWVADGRVPSQTANGTRMIRLDGMTDIMPDATHDNGDTPNTATTDALAIIDRQRHDMNIELDRLHQAVTNARAKASVAWLAAAVAGILAAVGAVWSVWSIERVRGQAAAADAAAGVLVGVVDAERQRADTMTGRVAELTGELVTATGQAEAERVRAELLADELADARAEADRAAAVPPMLAAMDGQP